MAHTTTTTLTGTASSSSYIHTSTFADPSSSSSFFAREESYEEPRPYLWISRDGSTTVRSSQPIGLKEIKWLEEKYNAKLTFMNILKMDIRDIIKNIKKYIAFKRMNNADEFNRACLKKL